MVIINNWFVEKDELNPLQEDFKLWYVSTIKTIHPTINVKFDVKYYSLYGANDSLRYFSGDQYLALDD